MKLSKCSQFFIHSLVNSCVVMARGRRYLGLLRGHNWVHFAHRLMLLVYCYLEFKLRYLKNLKLISIRVKELFDPTVL